MQFQLTSGAQSSTPLAVPLPRKEETSHSVRTSQVELGVLTKEQRELAIIVLQEEAESYAKDDEDVGSII